MYCLLHSRAYCSVAMVSHGACSSNDGLIVHKGQKDSLPATCSTYVMNSSWHATLKDALFVQTSLVYISMLHIYINIT